MRSTFFLACFAIATVAFAQTDGPFQIGYASYLDIGDSSVNITNSGASGGNLCANIYTFDPAAELISCCSCNVTPDALQSLSVRNSLISNTLTAAIPTSVVIKIVASTGICDPSAVASGEGAGALPSGRARAERPRTITSGLTTSGLIAWGTTIHRLPDPPVIPTSYYGTETAFSNATLSDTELTNLTALCGFIQQDGSGFGICKGCLAGGLGAATSGQ
jgi:hypothetical protein